MERQYKDSGIEWIGRIPEEWKSSQLSVLFSEHSNKNVGMQETNLLSLSYGKIIRKNINENGGLLPESFEGYNIIDKDDIVLRLTDLQNDKRSLRTGLCKERGIITSAYVTIRIRDNKNLPSYFYYLLHSCDECKVFYGLGAGVRQGMNYQDLKKLGIVVPSIAEQQRIANYLDEKCGEIDSLIGLQEQMIEKLKAYKQSVITEAVTKGLNPNAKLVPSGIDWIGDIPEGFILIKFKYIFDIIGGCGFKDIFQGESTGDYPFCKASDINGENIYVNSAKNWVSKELAKSENYNIIPSGSILISKIGEALKKNHRKINTCDCIVDNNCEGFSNKSNNDIRMLYYILKCVDMSWFDNQGTIPSINNDKLRNSYIPIPPIEEQKAIITYLDTKCTDIEDLIDLKQQKIEKLKDYKKSVIYEAVTGKTIIE